MRTGIHHRCHIVYQESRDLGIGSRSPAILCILEDILQLLEGCLHGLIGEVLGSLVAMLDEIRILAQYLIIVSLVEQKAHMPDILTSDYDRCHIAFILNGLAQSHKLFICSGLCKTVVIKIFFIVNDALCIFTGQRSCVYLTVKFCGGAEQGGNLLGQRLQLACPYIHCGISHLHDIGEFSDAVLGLDEFAVSTAITGLDGHGNIGICRIKSVNDLIHGSLGSLITICKDKC